MALAARVSPARVPSDARCECLASVEGGQYEAPIRPAAGVGSWRAHRHIRHPREPDVQVSLQSNHPLVRKVWAGHFLRIAERHPQPQWRTSASRAPERFGHRASFRCARLEPTPAAGRIAPAIWPSSTLALHAHLASEGTRAGDARGVSATTGLAKRVQRERCRALVRISTRKRQSARPRAFRPSNLSVTTGRAAEVRVTSCEIKASLSRK